MFSSTKLTFVALALTLSQAVSALQINTPATLTTCVPAQLSWTGATDPVYLSILPGGDSSATALENLPTVTSGSTYTWTVDLASGTNITLRITDSTGAVAYSSAVVIQAGSSTSCVGASSASGSSTASGTAVAASSAAASASSGAASATSAAASGTASAASAASSKAASATSAAGSAATSAAAAATSAASSASKMVIGSGLAGLMGLVVIGAGVGMAL